MPYDFFNEENKHVLKDFIKISQYGGVGGQASSFTPGSSPIGKGSQNGSGGNGVNEFSVDIGLDTIMARSNYPAPIDPESNFEDRLSSFHKDYEKDIVPYILTFEERLKLKHKQKIRDRERYLADANKPKEKPKSQEIEPEIQFEKILDSRRKNQNLKLEFEDKNPEQIKPSRYHSVLSSKKVKLAVIINRPTTTIFGPHEEEDERDEAGELSVLQNRLTQPFNGQGTFYTPEDGVDEYLRGITRDTYVDQNSGVRTLSWTYPLEDNIGYHSQTPTETEPSPMPDNLGDVPNETLEQNLSKLKSKKTERLPTTLFRLQDMDYLTRGEEGTHEWNSLNETYLDKDPGTSNLPNPLL